MKPLIFLILFTSSQLRAQETHTEIINLQDNTNDDEGIICKTGVGWYGAKGTGGPSLYASIDFVITQGSLLKLKYATHKELLILSSIGPAEELSEFGLLYGRGKTKESARIMFYGGLGCTWGTIRTDKILYTNGGFFSYNKYETIPIITFGVPLEFELSLFPNHYLGLSFSAFSNINLQKTISGFAIKVELGK